MQLLNPTGEARPVASRRVASTPAPSAPAVADTVAFSQPTTGNRVQPLIGGDQIFPAAETLIKGAKSHVQLQMYRLGYDKMIEALAQQARQGVKVQILLDPTPGYDAQDAKKQDAIKTYLRKAGVEILTYPVNKAGMIDHVKLLIVDGKKAIIGGMNWDQHSPMNMDADVLIEGPAVSHLETMQSRDWQFAGGADPNVRMPKASSVPTDGDAQVRLLSTTPAAQQQDIKAAVLDNIKNARKSIHMMAFCLADRDVIDGLKAAKARNPKLDVKVLLEPGKPVVYQNAKTAKELREAGIDVRFLNVNLETQEKLHAKLSTFDGDTLLVGSANFTNAGYAVNHEADVEVKSPSIGSAFDAFYNDQWDHRSCEQAPQVPDFEEKAPQIPVPQQLASSLIGYFNANYHPDVPNRWNKDQVATAFQATHAGEGLTRMSDADAKALSAYLAAGPQATPDSDDARKQQADLIGKLAGFISKPGLFETSPMPGDFSPLWQARLDISRKAQKDLPGHEQDYVKKMIASVSDPSIQDFVREAFAKVPKAFYQAPSSSTGKFHPADEVDPNDLDPIVMNQRNHAAPDTTVPVDHPYQGGGLVLHSARVVEVGKRLTDFFGIKGHDRDVVLAGLALHDIMKFATEEAVADTPAGQDVPWTPYTTPDHGPAGALWLSKLDPSKQDLAKNISHYVEYHMATWNEPHHTPPANLPELVVSLSDYIASQPNFYVGV